MKKFKRAEGTKYSWKGKKLDSTEETVTSVERFYVARKCPSLCLASKKLEMSRQKIHGILRTNLLKKTYRAKIILKLTYSRVSYLYVRSRENS